MAELINSLQQSSLDEKSPSGLIDTPTAVATLIDTLVNLPISPPSLYIDVEGVKLSRHGSISILQILAHPQGETYLIDIHTLKDEAFSTAGSTGQTLRGILESRTIPKVFFDVRHDSDALFGHYRIKLAGIVDLQLMELATRTFHRRYVSGLSKCVERDLQMAPAEARAWKEVKEKGLDMFNPERGGSYEVFNSRPLSQELVLYCVQDVQYMPQLWVRYNSRLSVMWAQKVAKATEERIASSQMATYDGKGKHMALSPKKWY